MEEGETKPGGQIGSRGLGQLAQRLLWTPKRLKWDPEANPEANHELGWGLNFLYAAVSCFPDDLE